MDVEQLAGEVAGRAPNVSIILPTYNRAKFLPQAFESIRSQQFSDWELIVVDDGSTDNTRELVAELCRGWPQRVCYVYQENQGAYGARNIGLDLAAGENIAFFDSDDVWLPEYLSELVKGLRANPEVDWAYCACRVIDLTSQRVVAESTFAPGGCPKPFLSLRTRVSGDFHIMQDPNTAACALESGLYAGLQNSVIRRRVFAGSRFNTTHRNEGEDVLTVVRVLARGHILAYVHLVLVVYSVHGENSSGAAKGATLEKRLDVCRAYVQGLEDLRREFGHRSDLASLLTRGVSDGYFWWIGYSLLWQNGRQREALRMFHRGLRLTPWRLRLWRTYLLALVRYSLSRCRRSRVDGPTAMLSFPSTGGHQ
jgi:glycosyltransferase involved in cell wall biosynthesis